MATLSNAKIGARVLERTSAFARYLQMLRQFTAISNAIAQLDVADRKRIGLTALAELTRVQVSTAIQPVPTEQNWQVEAAVAFARVRSQQPTVRVAGIKRWLVAAYRATFDSPYGEIQSLHRGVLRALRNMHGTNPTVAEVQLARSA